MSFKNSTSTIITGSTVLGATTSNGITSTSHDTINQENSTIITVNLETTTSPDIRVCSKLFKLYVIVWFL